ncbi:unnamed protein product, partial [Iphiclides podalirius]
MGPAHLGAPMIEAIIDGRSRNMAGSLFGRGASLVSGAGLMSPAEIKVRSPRDRAATFTGRCPLTPGSLVARLAALEHLKQCASFTPDLARASASY